MGKINRASYPIRCIHSSQSVIIVVSGFEPDLAKDNFKDIISYTMFYLFFLNFYND